MRPPVGVAVLGFFSLLNGISSLFIGLRLVGLVAFGPATTGSGLVFWGALAILIGILFLAVGYGAWTLRIWAWTWGMLVAILGIFNAVMILIATADLSQGLAAALLPAVVLWYLNSEGVKDAFVKGEQSRGGYVSDYDREMAQRMAAERADDTV
jgi:hypothetical protein